MPAHMLAAASRRAIAPLFCALAIVVSACQAGPLSSTSTTTIASVDPSPLPSTGEPTPSAPEVCVGATAMPAPEGLVSGTFADVVTDNLVRRTKPMIAEESVIIGELNAPVRVFLLEGPVEADGYAWWLVTPEGGNSDGLAWVAAAAKDGEEWLQPVPGEEGSWTRLGGRAGVWRPNVSRAVAGPDGRVYVFGGLGVDPQEPSPIADAWAFDPISCQWEDLRPMPKPRGEAQVAVGQDGRFFIIGLTDAPGSGNLSTMDTYDPATATWMTAASVEGLIGTGSAVVGDADGRIWGFLGHQAKGTVVYDPASQAWQSASNAGTWDGVEDAHLAPDGDIYLLLSGAGGVVRFDPDRGETTPVALPRVARYNAAMAPMADGSMLVMGGYMAGGCIVREDTRGEPAGAPSFPLLDAFDPASGGWRTLPPLPITGGSAVLIDERLYVVANEDDAMAVYRYEPPLGPVAGTTEARPGAGGCGG